MRSSVNAQHINNAHQIIARLLAASALVCAGLPPRGPTVIKYKQSTTKEELKKVNILTFVKGGILLTFMDG